MHHAVFGIDEILLRDFVEVNEELLSQFVEFAHRRQVEQAANEAAIVFGRRRCRRVDPDELELVENVIDLFDDETRRAVARLIWRLIERHEAEIKERF